MSVQSGADVLPEANVPADDVVQPEADVHPAADDVQRAADVHPAAEFGKSFHTCFFFIFPILCSVFLQLMHLFVLSFVS